MNPTQPAPDKFPKMTLKRPLTPKRGSTEQKGQTAVSRVASIRSRGAKPPVLKAVLVPGLRSENNTYGPVKGSK